MKNQFEIKINDSNFIQDFDNSMNHAVNYGRNLRNRINNCKVMMLE